MQARYYSSGQGRFAGVDPVNFGIAVINPQNWNRYIYALNNPLTVTDKNGKWPTPIHDLITKMAFPGLSSEERGQIDKGNKGTDFAGGYLVFPSTLAERNANEHSMTMPGQTVKAAKASAAKHVAEWDRMATRYESLKFSAFGRGDHTIQDETSPEHDFAVYIGLRFQQSPIIGGPSINTAIFYAWVLANVEHAKAESGITGERLTLAVDASRDHYERVFGTAAAKRATSGLGLFSYTQTSYIEVRDKIYVTDGKLLSSEECKKKYGNDCDQ
jgi:hypothetical protein